MKYVKLALFIVVMFIVGFSVILFGASLAMDNAILEFIVLLAGMSLIYGLLYLLKLHKVYQFKKIKRIELLWVIGLALLYLSVWLIRDILYFTGNDIDGFWRFGEITRVFFLNLNQHMFELIAFVVLPVPLIIHFFNLKGYEKWFIGIVIPLMYQLVIYGRLDFGPGLFRNITYAIPFIGGSIIYLKYENISSVFLFALLGLYLVLLKTIVLLPIIF